MDIEPDDEDSYFINENDEAVAWYDSFMLRWMYMVKYTEEDEEYITEFKEENLLRNIALRHKNIEDGEIMSYNVYEKYKNDLKRYDMAHRNKIEGNILKGKEIHSGIFK